MSVDDGTAREAAVTPALELWNEFDPSLRFVAVFPIRDGMGAVASTAVYYILEPGRHTGLHSENAEEVLYVFDGEGEVFVEGSQLQLRGGDFRVFPADAPHDIYAYGDRELRLLSFYPVALMESTFQQVLQPVNTNVLTSQPFGDRPPEAEPDES
jgi:quercetin dioxygenase-like cupin family protein